MKKLQFTDRELYVMWRAVCKWHGYPFTQALKSKLFGMLSDKARWKLQKSKLDQKINRIMYSDD